MLRIEPVITAQARKHSQDMASHRMKFGHQDFFKRIKIIYATIPHCNGGAENVAFNYKPTVIVQKWLQSPGHKRTIDKQGRIYYTQLFVRKKGK